MQLMQSGFRSLVFASNNTGIKKAIRSIDFSVIKIF